MTSKQRRLLFAATLLMAASPLLYLFVQGITFWVARGHVSREWAEVLPGEQRDPAVMRGIMEQIRMSGDSYSFVPQSSWDNSVCAGSIIGAVNFILGEERLEPSSAWMFEKVNAEHIARVYSREQDFIVEDGAIIETYDRGFGLAGILDMVGEGANRNMGRIYIVGYHYRDTRADDSILSMRRKGGTMNSHLMLLLGTEGGRWYGYHMFHDPEHPNDSPFTVMDMGECVECNQCTDNERCMPQLFDLMYIWEVRDVQLPIEGAPVQLVQHSASYAEVIDAIGDVTRFDHFRDTIRAHRADLGDNFPRVIQGDAGVVPGLPFRRSRRGDVLGTYNGVPIYRHGGSNERGPYGLEYQCVEFVNRYYATHLGHRNMTQTGNADTYWYAAPGKGLDRYENGSRVAPRVDDILTFDPEGNDDVPGHVAIISSVSDSEVCVVQQNAIEWHMCFDMRVRDGTYTITEPFANMPAVGWSRQRSP